MGAGAGTGEGAGVDAGADEHRVQRSADLVLDHEILPGPAPLPDFTRLLGARARRGRLRVAFGAAGIAAVAAVVAVATLKDLAPVSYVVAGQAAIAGTRIGAAGAGVGAGTRAAAGEAAAHIRFSEGTEVTLAPGAELDVVKRTGRGAVLAMEHGQARFSVVHKRGARWTVVSGPFAIEVTGTEFTVDWSPDVGRMVVDLRAGSVRVRGASVGGAVELNAGERLVATVSDHRVTVSPTADAAGAELPVGGGRAGDPSASRSGAATREAGGWGGPSAPPSSSSSRSSASSPFASSPLAAPAVGAPTAPADAAGAGASALAGDAATLSGGAARAGSSPSRVVIGGTGRTAGRVDGTGPLALWSPHEAARHQLPERRLPEVVDTGASAARARPPVSEGPRTDPAPAGTSAPPALSESLTLGGGGLFCVNVPAQYTFEQPVAGLSVPPLFTLAFANPRVDRTHSWCGESSIRVDATFDDDGRQNFFGRFLNETGQLLIKLDHPTDFTGRTVTMHVFVDGPWDARFSAELAVVDHGRWVSAEPSRGLSPGRWWTISHRFTDDNAAGVRGSSNPYPFPTGVRSPVTAVDRLALAIRTTGELRTWKGAVFVDDVSWR